MAGYVPEVDILQRLRAHRLSEGEIVVVIGPNGAGKSTLIKAMFGLVPLRPGRVGAAREDITGLPAHA